MKVTVSVDIDGSSIVVHTRYENLTGQSILIKRGAWGISREHPNVVDGAEEEFAINEKLHGLGLQFNGLIVDSGVPWKREDFTPIAPGEVVASSIRIGPLTQQPLQGRYLYEFLPGTHQYEIRTQYIRLDEGSGIFKSWWSEPTTFTFTSPLQRKAK